MDLEQLERIQTMALRIGELPDGDAGTALSHPGPPGEIQIFRNGLNRSANGYWILYDAEGAEQIRRAYELMGHDLYIDYDHMMFRAAFLEGESPAAGWFTLGFREDGLWAENVRWTSRALEKLRALEYRYFSPTVGVGEAGMAEDGLPQLRAISVENMALTNNPALAGIAPLIAASKRYADLARDHKRTEEKEDAVPEETETQVALSSQLLANLGLAEDASEEMVLESIEGLKEAKLEAERLAAAVGAKGSDEALGRIEGLKAQQEAADERLTAMQAQLDELAQAKAANEHEDLIAAAVREGKLRTADVKWAKEQNTEMLRGFLAEAPKRYEGLATKVDEPALSATVANGSRRAYDEVADRRESEVGREMFGESFNLDTCTAEQYRAVQSAALQRFPELAGGGA